MDVLELDVSKYDKSQNEFHCAVEYEIWRRLGLEDFLAEVWKQGHRKTTLKDYTAGIKTCLWYQRKSGDVTTFIGNTVIIASCLASMLPMEKLIKEPSAEMTVCCTFLRVVSIPIYNKLLI